MSATAIATDLFARLESAWNRADGSAFGGAFTDDGDFVDIRGVHHHGADVIGKGHEAILASTHAGSVVRYEVEAARQLEAGTVLALVAATLDAPTGPLQGTNRSRITAVITARDGRWAITGFHNTLVQPPSAP
jgi:uncharacterized protein (TIGR02246 family)